MLLLRCTGKMLKRLGEKPGKTKVALPPDSLGEWYVNTIDWLDDGGFAICLNARARYALLVDLADIETAGQLAGSLAQRLLAHLLDMSVPQGRLAEILADCQAVHVARTASRSLLATMNDMLNSARSYIGLSCDETGTFDPREIEGRLNTRPLRPLDWRYALEAMWDVCTEGLAGVARKVHLPTWRAAIPHIEAAGRLGGSDLATKIDAIAAGATDVLFDRDELRRLRDALAILRKIRYDGAEPDRREILDMLYRSLSHIIESRFDGH